MEGMMNIIIPDAMISSIETMAKSKNCSKNTVVKLAVAKFLFDQTLTPPQVFENKIKIKHSGNAPIDISNEIPLEKIVSVQYTLDDGRIIHIIRESKIR